MKDDKEDSNTEDNYDDLDVDAMSRSTDDATSFIANYTFPMLTVKNDELTHVYGEDSADTFLLTLLMTYSVVRRNGMEFSDLLSFFTNIDQDIKQDEMDPDHDEFDEEDLGYINLSNNGTVH
jgi:hypothetical protein